MIDLLFIMTFFFAIRYRDTHYRHIILSFLHEPSLSLLSSISLYKREKFPGSKRLR